MYVHIEPGPPIDGVLSYHENEYSFRFEVTSPHIVADREGHAGRTSVSIGTLQIEVGVSTRKSLFVWGLHPRTLWTEGRLLRPSFKSGVVIFDAEFETAVSRTIASVGEWSTTYDPCGRWLRVAPDGDSDEVLTEIAGGVLLGEKRGELNSVWLNPTNI